MACFNGSEPEKNLRDDAIQTEKVQLRIREILAEWDPRGGLFNPDGVFYPEWPDEDYDFYIPELTMLVRRAASVEEVIACLMRILDDRESMEPSSAASNTTRLRQFAERLLGVRMHFR